MNAVFGWVQGSNMARTYVHMSGRDVDAALLQAAGIEASNIHADKPLSQKICPRCRETNPVTTRFCYRCSAPLDSSSAYKLDEEAEGAGALLTELLQDSELQAILKEHIKKKLSAGGKVS